MWILSPRLSPFSSFSIDLGPHYIERVFDSWLSLAGIPNVVSMTAKERYEAYIEILEEEKPKSNKSVYPFTQFFFGHFYQQLALVTPSLVNGNYFREKALGYYQSCAITARHKDESRYYSLWQIGVLEDALNYSWDHARTSLFEAFNSDPIRAEALKKIVDHYIQAKEFPQAHALSEEIICRFFGKHPEVYRKWFIDPDAYNWKILKTHQDICNCLNHEKSRRHTK